jgi:hypothetical protein
MKENNEKNQESAIINSEIEELETIVAPIFFQNCCQGSHYKEVVLN